MTTAEVLAEQLTNKDLSSLVIQANFSVDRYEEFKVLFQSALEEEFCAWERFDKLICYTLLTSIFHKDLAFAKSIIEKYDIISKDTLPCYQALARFYHDCGHFYKSVYYYEKLYDSAPDRLDILDMERFLAVARATGRFTLSGRIIKDALSKYENILVWKLKAFMFQIEIAHLQKIEREVLINNFKYLYPKISTVNEYVIMSSAAYQLGNFGDFSKLMNLAFEKYEVTPDLTPEKREFSADLCLESAEEIISFLESCGYSPFLVFGTLLGMYRDGKLMDYDKDADLGLFVTGLDDIHRMVKRLCEENEHFACPNIVMKPFENHTLNLAIYDLSRGTAVDLFFFYRREDQAFTGIVTQCGPIEWMFDFIEIDRLAVQGKTYPIPKNPENFLVSAYGESWSQPIEIWDSTIDCPNLSEQSKAASTMFATNRLYSAMNSGKVKKVEHYYAALSRRLNFPFSEKANTKIQDRIKELKNEN